MLAAAPRANRASRESRPPRTARRPRRRNHRRGAQRRITQGGSGPPRHLRGARQTDHPASPRSAAVTLQAAPLQAAPLQAAPRTEATTAPGAADREQRTRRPAHRSGAAARPVARRLARRPHRCQRRRHHPPPRPADPVRTVLRGQGQRGSPDRPPPARATQRSPQPPTPPKPDG